MEIYGNLACVSYDDLVGGGIMTAAGLKQLRHRGQLTQTRRGCYGTPALFSVDSLPHRYRVEVYRRWPDLQEKAESKPFVERVQPDGQAMAFYAGYVLSDGRHLTLEKQTEYANNCAIMNAFRSMVEAANSQRIRQSKPRVKMCEFWRKAAAALLRLSDRWPNSLPTSERRLQRKFQEYVREGYETFISGKFQNRNAGKVLTEEQEGVLTQLLAHHNNLDNAQIAVHYNMIGHQLGWKEITASAIGVWREKLALVTTAGRRGVTNFRNELTMQVRRTRPTAPFLMWTLDGWDVELLYQATTEDRKGHRVTTYHNRLTLEVVLDPSCDYPIGYAIGTHETPALITEALRNAARHTEQLFGQMFRVGQIQCDHYGIKTMTDLYNVIGSKLTPARVKNAKAKVVEPYFGYLNKTYCQLLNNWSGFGITSDPKKQPNAEALNMIRHSFPDEQGVRAQIVQMMELERQRKVGKLRELMVNLPADRLLPLDREQYLFYFGASTGQMNALEGCGLRPTLLGIKRDYDCFDIRFREHAGERWAVRYDPEDLSQVLAVSEDGTLRFMLEEKHRQPMALADRREGDAEQLARVNQFNRGLEEHVTRHLAHAGEITEEVLRQLPQQDNILNRLLIVNSRGQHKLPKAEKRLGLEAGDRTEKLAAQWQDELTEVPLVPHGANEGDRDDYSIF